MEFTEAHCGTGWVVPTFLWSALPWFMARRDTLMYRLLQKLSCRVAQFLHDSNISTDNVNY